VPTAEAAEVPIDPQAQARAWLSFFFAIWQHLLKRALFTLCFYSSNEVSLSGLQEINYFYIGKVRFLIVNVMNWLENYKIYSQVFS